MAWNDPQELRKRFSFLCGERWEGLEPTDEPGRRFCAGCSRHVHRASSRAEFDSLAAKGLCVFAATGDPTGDTGWVAGDARETTRAAPRMGEPPHAQLIGQVRPTATTYLLPLAVFAAATALALWWVLA